MKSNQTMQSLRGAKIISAEIKFRSHSTSHPIATNHRSLAGSLKGMAVSEYHAVASSKQKIKLLLSSQ